MYAVASLDSDLRKRKNGESTAPTRREKALDSLQQTFGNRAVTRYLEQEADRYADSVTRSGAPLDLGGARIHTDRAADEAAREHRARAFTFGRDIYFRHGEYAPDTAEGKRVLAHEVAHTRQQEGGTAHVQRDADPICEKFDFDKLRGEIKKQAAEAPLPRSPLIDNLKIIRRCGTETNKNDIVADLTTALGATVGAELWAESAKVFGGYVGMFPGYAPDMKTELERLGAGSTVKFSDFDITLWGNAYKKAAKSVATGELTDLASTDIIYFRGHQYARYNVPFLYANFEETRGVDLRYVEKVGGFGNVKLFITTSCATLCKEAFEVFHPLFPNAIMLGYRNSAPEKGHIVREKFRKAILALGRPLILTNAGDKTLIIDTWKSIVETHHKGNDKPQPGYYDGTDVHYFDGSVWKKVTPTDAKNECGSKGDYTSQYPGP